MLKLNDEATLKFAIDVTLSAIENKLISNYSSPEEQAEAVAIFFKKLVKNLSEDN